jgi:hypothetical protein
MNPAACQRCGSDRVQRAHARTPWERLVRSVTPLRRYRCQGCGHRGWSAAPLSRHDRTEGATRPPAGTVFPAARPPEARDVRASWRRRTRLITTVALAVLLGALAATRLASCQNQPFQGTAE